MAWVSKERADRIIEEDVASISPEICVEVISVSNTIEEMAQKKDLYFTVQAKEVCFCDRDGRIRFFNRQGELEKSLLVPDFPKQIRRRDRQTD